MGTFRQEYVRCGKAACKSCPHGPYWYEYWRDGPKVRKRYIGKKRPDAPGPDGGPEELHPWDAILCSSTATMFLACEILGIEEWTEKQKAFSAWSKIAMKHHPDRGGDEQLFMRMNAAWSYYRARRGW